MKHLFLAAGFLLSVLSGVTWMMFPGVASDRTVIYWVTDPNPAREEQIAGFERWQVKHGHTDERGMPTIEVRLDSANDDDTKRLVQGVAGVAGDVMDLFNGGAIWRFAEIGILEDLTEPAKEYGFGLDQTYDSVRPELVREGAQYAFPCNVTCHHLWVNAGMFREVGLEPPPRRWTWDEFERLGAEYVRRANEGLDPPKYFFTDSIRFETMMRSMGLSVFNETMTATRLDDPRFAEVLEIRRRWTEELRLMPTKADRESFNTESGYGGDRLALFRRGNYAMLLDGRYAIIQFRAAAGLELSVSEEPYKIMPNATLGTRAAAVYIDSDNKEAAYLFLSYLASEPYNQQVVRDGDGLPPNPVYTQTDDFLRPPQHPTEHGLHEVFASSLQEIAIGGEYSPFVLDDIVGRALNRAQSDYENHRVESAAQAGLDAKRKIDSEILRSVDERPRLREPFQEAQARQKRIDELRAAGEPVPLELIDNPVILRWERFVRARGDHAARTELAR